MIVFSTVIIMINDYAFKLVKKIKTIEKYFIFISLFIRIKKQPIYEQN